MSKNVIAKRASAEAIQPSRGKDFRIASLSLSSGLASRGRWLAMTPLLREALQEIVDEADQQIELVAGHRQRVCIGRGAACGLEHRLLIGLGAEQQGLGGQEAQWSRRNAAGCEADKAEAAIGDDGAGADLDQRPFGV